MERKDQNGLYLLALKSENTKSTDAQLDKT